MTRFNTGNPIDSSDPRDLSDNAKNLDQAINSESATFTDRLGNERVTLAGGVDPSGFAQSALNDANRAESEANRAEAARDAAFVNADVYEDTAAGLAGTSEGEQFQVVDGVEVVRYRNESGSAAEVARYPASEFVRIALDVASQPGLVSGEFYADDEEQPVYAITDEDGQALAAWNQQGEMDANPSLDMAEKSQRARGEFHTSDDQPAFALTDEEGRPLYAVDENGQPIVPFIGEFHTEDGQPSFAWTDKNGVVFYGIDDEGRNVVGGGEGSGIELQENDRGLLEGAFWSDELSVSVTREYPVEYFTDEYVSFPDHLAIYDFMDSLMAEFGDYISRESLGQDGLGNELYLYRVSPADVRNNSTYTPEQLPHPKIILVGLLHGNEQHAGVANLLLIREICRDWRRYPNLMDLRWGCEILFLPCINPSGYDARTRNNHNGVDLNRNFPSTLGDKSGVEIETAVLMDFVEANQDAVALIDHHRMFSLASNGYSVWAGCENPRLIGSCRTTLNYMSGWIRRQMGDLVDQTNEPYSRMTDSPSNRLRGYADLSGCGGILLETPAGVNGDQKDKLQHSREALLFLIHTLYAREMRLRENLWEFPFENE